MHESKRPGAGVAKLDPAKRRFAELFCLISIIAAGLFLPPASAEAANLIANPSFEQAGANGDPSGWIRGRWGTNTAVFTYPVSGAEGEKGASVELESYSSGDAKWAFGHVPAEPGRDYEFSDTYKSTETTYVTAEFKLADGSTTYRDFGILPPAAEWTEWTGSFTAPPNAVSVSVFHVIKSVGTLSVDDYSLDILADTDPPPQDPDNLVPNASFEEAGANGDPAGWIRGRWGTNTAVFEYPAEAQEGDRGAGVRMTSRTTGDAKWSFGEVPVEGGQMYVFSDYYKSDVPTYVTLQYRMSNGTFQYPDLALLPAAADWEKSEHSFTAPAGAQTVTVFHVINQVGELVVDNYRLEETSSPVEPSKGIVSLTFDDGTRSIYDNAFPILEDAGLPSTQYIVSGRFDFPGYVNESEVLAMEAAGHEIGAHTITHPDLTTLSPAAARQEIEQSKADLLAIGVDSVTSFAYPFGAYNDAVRQMVVDAGFVSARSTDGGYNTMGLLNSFALARQPVNIGNSAAQVKGWIDTALANDQWLILAFHHVDQSGETYSTTPEILQEIVNYLKSKNVTVVTVSEGIELMK